MDVLLVQVNKDFSPRPKSDCSSDSSSEGATVCLEELWTKQRDCDNQQVVMYSAVRSFLQLHLMLQS